MQSQQYPKYPSIVTELFFNINHAGVLDCSQAFTICNDNKQDKNFNIKLYLQANLENIIELAKFKTNGNPYIIAGCEWLCQQIEHTDLNIHPYINYSIINNVLQLPKPYYPIALLIENSYNKAITLLNNKLNNKLNNE